MKIDDCRISDWMALNYMWVINCCLILFLGISFLAPILFKLKMSIPGWLLYKFFSPFCHQLAFRSWFLFGPQLYYPRALAGIPGILSYEQATGDLILNLEFAREFIGNDALGFKVALCQRDIAIYGSLLLFGLFFQIRGKKIKTLHWCIWIIFGLLPIGLDGITQFGGLGINFLSWLPYRESTPLLRTFTGVLFGVTTGWFLYPMIEESMQWSNKRKAISTSINHS